MVITFYIGFSLTERWGWPGRRPSSARRIQGRRAGRPGGGRCDRTTRPGPESSGTASVCCSAMTFWILWKEKWLRVGKRAPWVVLLHGTYILKMNITHSSNNTQIRRYSRALFSVRACAELYYLVKRRIIMSN